MSYNPNASMNDSMRRAGSRSRGTYVPPSGVPNIGQTPAVQAANLVLGQQPSQAPQQPAASPPPGGAPGASSPMPGMTPAASPGSNPLAAPAVQPSTMTLHPPGSPADPNQYNYEPQPDGAWRVYPPGVPAPNHAVQASLPRAASTADYRRMADAFRQMPQTATSQSPLV